jgi:glutamate/tyrosine decarboxylase-like PLP-dependent enzyme
MLKSIDHIFDEIENLETNKAQKYDSVHKYDLTIQDKGHSLEDLLPIIFTDILHKGLRTTSPHFFGYIPAGGLWTASLAEFISTMINRYSAVHLAAPRLAEAETEVIKSLLRMVGLDDKNAKGFLTTGGSLAHLYGISTAINNTRNKFKQKKPIVYYSDQTHHCIDKSLATLGLEKNHISIIKSDDEGKILINELRQKIEIDLQKGHYPLLLIGNAGTIHTGAVDSLTEMAELSLEYKMWFHVDAAYGGFFNLTPTGKKELNGLHLADSLVMDPHKGMFMPYGTGCLLVKQGEYLEKAFKLESDYIPKSHTNEKAWNFADLSPELSKDNRALRMWLSLKYFGVSAFGKALGQKIELTQYLEKKLALIPHIKIVSKRKLTTLCISYKNDDKQTEHLLDLINRTSKAFVSSTTFKNKFVIRICVVSHRTDKKNIVTLIEAIYESSKKVTEDLKK